MGLHASRVLIVLGLLVAPAAPAADWVRGGAKGQEPQWGIRDRLQFAIPPASSGPRGLVRLLYPTLPDGKYDLINFIAIEPVVHEHRGLSELEYSKLDKTAGKRFSVEAAHIKGELSVVDQDVEKLQVVIDVEDFDNGARVKLIIEQRSDRPDEIALTLQAKPDSAPLEYGILTATMGNKARTRLLWLRNETVSSLKLYEDYRGVNFAESKRFPLDRVALTAEGDLLAAITTDEPDPAAAHPFPGSKRWYYGGFPVTQYWKMTKGGWRNDVRVVVNGRFRYWRSLREVPGGIAFENFELNEAYRAGQKFIFGITRRTPAELGLNSIGATKPAVSR